MDQVQLIICANGCTDNTSYYLTRLKNQFERLGFGEHIQILTHDVPLGFAGACNQGLNMAQGERVVILHNDCVLLPQTQYWLHMLDAPFEQQAQVGITCTRHALSSVTDQIYAPFFCVMMDRHMIQQVGMLNEE